MVERLTVETGRDAVEAEMLARWLEDVHPTLRADLVRWVTEHEVDLDREVQGWSLRRLVKENRSKHVSEAFTWMSALLFRPEETLRRLNARRDEIVMDPEWVARERRRQAH